MSAEIETYLMRKTAGKYGTCKVCAKSVYWSRQKLGSHKRSGNCSGQAFEEKQMFISQKRRKISSLPGVQHAKKYEMCKKREPINETDGLMGLYKSRLDLLENFAKQSLVQKRRYIRKQAPDKFLDLLREVIRNVILGHLYCNAELLALIKRNFICTRLNNSETNKVVARALLGESGMVNIICKLLPGAIAALTSLGNKEVR